MLNPKTTKQLTVQYEKYLDEVVDRLWVVVYTAQELKKGRVINQYAQMDLELCVLQLRKALEVVGYMCLLAHRPELGKFPKRISKLYSPKDIIKELKDKNSSYFPVPVQIVEVNGVPDLQPIEMTHIGSVMSEEALLNAYGKYCGTRMHANHVYQRGSLKVLEKEIDEACELAYGLLALLKSHRIIVQDKYLIFAQIVGESGVRVHFFNAKRYGGR